MFRFFLLCAFTCILTVSCGKKKPEGAAVIVNGYAIMRPEIIQTAEMLRESMISAFPEKAVEGLTDEHFAGAAHQLIANRLLIEEARQRGIQPTAKAIDSGLAAIKKRLPDEAAFKREMIRMGETDSSFRAKIAEGICLDSLMTLVLQETPPVTTSKCKDFYEANKKQYLTTGRIRIAQIFLPFTDNMSDDARTALSEKANDILTQLSAGKSFATCAKSYSHGPGVEAGGDLGWFKKGDLRKDLEEPVWPLEKGNYSDVVKTDIGLHILQKSDEESERQMPFEEVEKRIKLLLEIKGRNEVVSTYLDSLTSKAHIEFLDSSLVNKPQLQSLGMIPEAAATE